MGLYPFSLYLIGDNLPPNQNNKEVRERRREIKKMTWNRWLKLITCNPPTIIGRLLDYHSIWLIIHLIQ